MKLAALLFVTLVPAALAQQAEEKTSEHRTFPGVREIIIDNVFGSITVETHSGSSAEVDIAKTLRAETADRAALARKEVTLNVTQEGGLVRVYVDGPFRCNCGDGRSFNWRGWPEGYKVRYDFNIKVPASTRLDLRTVNDSEIKVSGVSGDYRISNVNGGIEMLEIAGAGEIHTVNGPVKVTFAKNPAGAVSFKSVNGTLDVTFRDGLNADARMKTFNGGLFTDFDVTAAPAGIPEVAEARRGTKYVYRGNRFTGVRIGTGGPELRFETLNGNVYIRKRGQ